MTFSANTVARRSIDGIRRAFTFPLAEKALLLLSRGARYGGVWTRLLPGPQYYPPGSRRQVSRGGINFDLDLSCLMQWYVFWGFRERERDRLYSLINEGDTVLDVGTNVGETLLNFARRVGPSGRVIGFEPDEANHANAVANLALNGFANAKVLKLGVSDRRETVRLYRVDPHNLGMNRILSAEEAAGRDDFSTIEVATLDEIAAEHGIDRIDLIKIDIEGWEMHALRGARRLLETLRPRLFIEVGYTRLIENGTSPAELFAFLDELGYDTMHADTDERLTKDADLSSVGDGSIDVYALPRAV